MNDWPRVAKICSWFIWWISSGFNNAKQRDLWNPANTFALNKLLEYVIKRTTHILFAGVINYLYVYCA